MESTVGNDSGSGGGGQRRAKGENWGNCNRITIKMIEK